MTRYLAYTSPARGHLYPIVPTLLALRERGHEVHVRTLASQVPVLVDLGLDAKPIASAIEEAPLDDWEANTPEEGLGRALATFARRAPHEVADLRRSIDAVKPDALLIDVTTIGAAAVAEASGLDWVTTIPLFQHFSFGPQEATDLKYVPFAINPPSGLAVLNGPRVAVGLEPLSNIDDAWRAPLHLYYTAPPFESPKIVFPESFELVGPGVWEPPAECPGWLADLAEPIVLVSASSERQSDDALLHAALQGLAKENMSVVVSTAAHDPTGYAASANTRVERWLPHGPVVRVAACVVCHGGMGIVQKALAVGVPVCVVPFGRDQFEVAKRVVACGAGTAVMPDRLTPEALALAVREAMTLRAGAERVAQGFASAGGAAAAADVIESRARFTTREVLKRG